MRDRLRLPRLGRQRGIAAMLIALFVFIGGALPALAAGPVQDDANMLSASARTSAESKSAQIQRDTGKTITVKSVPNLGGKDISATADQFFQQQKLNGVLLYLARDDKKFKITIGTDTRQAISTTEEGAIRDQMTQRFAANDFDGGVLNAMDRIGADLRAAAPARTGQTQTAPAAKKSSSGFPVILIVLLVLLAVGAVVFLLMRRNRGGGVSGGSSGGYGQNYGPQQGGYPPQGGYGPGYGPGYGQQGGGGPGIGGSIIGGAAAGIGGAIVGNAIYDHFRDDNNNNNNNNNNDNSNRDNSAVGDYGASGNDQGNVSDSGQDVGSWGGGDSSVGDWGGGGDSGGDSGGGDPGSN